MESVCLHCGKLFTGIKDGKGNPPKFCNRSCYDNHRTESRNLCLNCGERVKGGGAVGGYKYCSHKCKVEHKKPQPRPCVNCKTVFTPIKFHTGLKRYIAYNAGKTCSAKCQNQWIRNNPERKRKISIAFTGKNHPAWEGGKTALNVTTHRGSRWNEIAEKARARDGYVCQCCGKTQEENGRKLDVHHKVKYHDINDSVKANRLSNLVTLCKSCHKKEDGKIKNSQMIFPFAVIAREDRGVSGGSIFTRNPLYEKKPRSAESRAKTSASIRSVTRNHEIIIEWNGQSKSLANLARDHGITRDILYRRIKAQKWSIEKALTEPVAARTKRQGHAS